MAIGNGVRISAAWRSRSAAWYSPSALMTLARRSRSASAWRAMERFIASGRSTALTSTTETFRIRIFRAAGEGGPTGTATGEASRQASTPTESPETQQGPHQQHIEFLDGPVERRIARPSGASQCSKGVKIYLSDPLF